VSYREDFFDAATAERRSVLARDFTAKAIRQIQAEKPK
jgi:hypothetical protein